MRYFLNKKRLKVNLLKQDAFGLSETILSLVMLSFITTYALYFVSLRQSNLFNANLNPSESVMTRLAPLSIA